MTLEKIKRYLKSKIKIIFIKTDDNSQLHNYSKKNLTHLQITIISNDFINKKFIERHRLIFSILAEIIEEKIYSITLNTYTLHEWKYKEYSQKNVSQCLKRK